MMIYWTFSSGSFGAYMKEHSEAYVNFVLFMVPKGVGIEHAYSVRQAKALGARQVWHASAGPS